jgi:phosphoribosyl isomerase A
MSLIPVIDLMGGQVVRGVKGQRQTYRPIVSKLCRSSDPVTVARILVEHCEAEQLYIADLDALTGNAAQRDVLCALLQALPALELWLDAGFADAAAAHALLDALQPFASRVVPVFASESLASRAVLERCFTLPAARAAGADSLADSLVDSLEARAVLSLDRRDGQRLDAAGCWEAVPLWPRRVIVMTLERVGSGEGPDLTTLRETRARAPGVALIGAGGVRSAADLAATQAAGADAWLVASALHDLQLPRMAG